MWLTLCLLLSFTRAEFPDAAENEIFHWNQGRQAYETKDYSQAIFHLQRLVSRYPTATHVREALMMLGISYVEKGKFQAARAPIDRFLEAKDIPPAEWLKAKSIQTRATLGAHQWNQALSLTHEILRKMPLEAEAHLLKAKAFDSMHRNAEREEWLQSFDQVTRDKNVPVLLLTEADSFRVELKLRTCPKIAALDEVGIRTQVSGRGLCLQEALVLVHQTLQRGETPWTQRSILDWNTNFASFRHSCLAPPAKRIRGQGYKELRSRILKDCQEFQTKILETLETWNQSQTPLKEIIRTVDPPLL